MSFYVFEMCHCRGIFGVWRLCTCKKILIQDFEKDYLYGSGFLIFSPKFTQISLSFFGVLAVGGVAGGGAFFRVFSQLSSSKRAGRGGVLLVGKRAGSPTRGPAGSIPP